MMSVTDHDTVEATAEARLKAEACGMLFINGVEISTREHDYLHILGYGINIEDKKLLAFLEENRQKRNIRVKTIIKKLQKAGVDITQEEVFSLAKTSASRAHVADALKKRGFVHSRQEAFRKYLVEGKAGYAPSEGPTAAEAIRQIKSAGGKAFIAHPRVVKDQWAFPIWVTAGLEGIEVYYPSHSFETRQDLLTIAEKYNLLVSAGSDYHGKKSGRYNQPGMETPQDVYKNLKSVFIG
jgi:predicted metal-dependent phosphoesterase TrpH